MGEVLLDTSFLMAMANRPIRGMERLEINLGRVEFLIPDVVVHELERIAGEGIGVRGVKRAKEAKAALQIIGDRAFRFRIIALGRSVKGGEDSGGGSGSGSGNGNGNGSGGSGYAVDDLIVGYAESMRCYVATLDKGMIRRLRGRCAGIVTLQDDALTILI
ncbi:MAG: hypothetical protein RMJ59_04650 [Candidatus Nitrosocaldus sp.]|nr:hypothetical protein [Candidatus Nitrosocaldus sp.]MDW8275654.1 hypothetical protein [Candidatus Nitrosocaldus sp.]